MLNPVPPLPPTVDWNSAAIACCNCVFSGDITRASIIPSIRLSAMRRPVLAAKSRRPFLPPSMAAMMPWESVRASSPNFSSRSFKSFSSSSTV